jgi:hypothetical protein
MLGCDLKSHEGQDRRVPERDARWPLALNERNAVVRSAMRGVGRAIVRRMPAQNAFHLILQVEFAFLQPDFFELFGFGEVMAGRQVVDLFVEDVMLRG